MSGEFEQPNAGRKSNTPFNGALLAIGIIVAVALIGTALATSGSSSSGTNLSPAENMSGAAVSATDPPSEEGLGGRYDHLFTEEAVREENAALRKEGPAFRGRVNGIYVDRDYHPRCFNWIQMQRADFERYPVPVPTVLPPGAEVGDPQGWVCGNEPLFVERIIEMQFAVAIGVARRFETDTLRASAGKRRVEKGTIQGRPAVFIRPLTPRGAGNSYIAFRDGADLIVFSGLEVSFSELRDAAESFPL